MHTIAREKSTFFSDESARFYTQGSLFGSLGSISPGLFAENDRYRLFAQKIWPVLARSRRELEKCYCMENGRAGVEPVLLLGVLIFQFLERLPDRQAVEMVNHLGWKLALNLALEEKGFHPTTLVYFRERLLEHEEATLASGAVLEALEQEGLVAKRGRRRLDSTHVVGLVACLSSLECMRETLRLALEELVTRDGYNSPSRCLIAKCYQRKSGGSGPEPHKFPCYG